MNLNGNGVAKMATKLDLDLDFVLNCADHKNSIKSNRMKSRRIADSNIIPSPSPLFPLCATLLCPWLTPLQTSLDRRCKQVEAAAPSPSTSSSPCGLNKLASRKGGFAFCVLRKPPSATLSLSFARRSPQHRSRFTARYKESPALIIRKKQNN